MGGKKFRALAPVSLPVSNGKTIFPPPLDPRQKEMHLDQFIVEDRPNGPGKGPVDTYLHLCDEKYHYSIHTVKPVDESETDDPHIFCHVQGLCSGIDDQHSKEFSEDSLPARERLALKTEAFAHSPSIRKLVDLFVQTFKK
jgi:hypothetical protein